MNHYVPDFEMDDDFAMIPASSSSSILSSHKKTAMQEEDEIMELLWHNGQVVTQSQTQISLRKSTPVPSKYCDAVLPAEQTTTPSDIRLSSTSQLHQQQQNLFIQEDEMASWLHYPLHDTNFVDQDPDFCSDLLYPPSSSSCVSTSTTCAPTPPLRTTVNPEALQQLPVTAISSAATRPPIPPARRAEVVQNFAHFSRHRASTASVAFSQAGPSGLETVVRESTAVDSSDTPSATAARSPVRASSTAVAAGTSSAAAHNSRETVGTSTTLEMTVTSSPGCSSASAEAHPIQPPPAEDRKRKGREEERDTECQGEVSDLISCSFKALRHD